MKLPVIFYALDLLFTWQFFLPAAPYAAPTEDEILRQIGVDENPGAQAPLDLPFSDSESGRGTLGKLFSGGPGHPDAELLLL